jgi:hypothetical protein
MMELLPGNYKYSICLLILLTNCGGLQRTTIEANYQDRINFSLAALDGLGNLYYSNETNEVYKLDPEGRRLGYYSNNQLGAVGAIDATSPLKLLIYYPDFDTGVILDRWMHETSRFNTIDFGLGEVETVALSRDGFIWVFDDIEQRLKQVDQLGNVMLRGEDLRLLFSERMKPTRLSESGSHIFLLIPNESILLFDLFGSFVRSYRDPAIINYQVVARDLIIQKESSIIIYNLETQLQQERDLPEDLKLPSRLLYHGDVWVSVHEGGVQRLPIVRD